MQSGSHPIVYLNSLSHTLFHLLARRRLQKRAQRTLLRGETTCLSPHCCIRAAPPQGSIICLPRLKQRAPRKKKVSNKEATFTRGVLLGALDARGVAAAGRPVNPTAAGYHQIAADGVAFAHDGRGTAPSRHRTAPRARRVPSHRKSKKLQQYKMRQSQPWPSTRRWPRRRLLPPRAGVGSFDWGGLGAGRGHLYCTRADRCRSK